MFIYSCRVFLRFYAVYQFGIESVWAARALPMRLCCYGALCMLVCACSCAGARRGGRRSADGRRRQLCSERHGAAALLPRRALTRDPNNFVHWKLFIAIPDGTVCRGSLCFRTNFESCRKVKRASDLCYLFIRIGRSIFEYSLNASQRSFRNAVRRSRVNGRCICSIPASRLLCFCWWIFVVNLDSCFDKRYL